MRTGSLLLGIALLVGCGDNLDLDGEPDTGERPAARGEETGGAGRVEPGGEQAPAQAEVLVKDALGASDLQVAGDRIYFVAKSDLAWELRWVRPTGGPVMTALDFGDLRPVDVVFAGDDVYWIAGQGGRVLRTSMATTGPSEVLYADRGAPPTALAVGKKAVYLGLADGCVRRIWLGEDPAVERIACTAGTPVVIAADEPDVYWGTAEGALFHWDGGAADKRISGESFDSRLAIDGGSVYWLNAHARAVQVMERDAHGAKPLATAQYAPVGMAMDASWIYFTTWSDESVKRVAKVESPVEVLADQQAEPADIALHGDRAYWLNEGQGTIMALQIQQP